MSLKSLLAIALIATFTSCQDIFNDDSKDVNCKRVACTEDFRMITVSFKDHNGNAIELESFQVFYKETGKEFPLDEDLLTGMEKGVYVIASDRDMEDVTMEGTDLIFRASTSTKSTISEDVVIGKDCCHIDRLDDGDWEFTL